MAKVKIQGNASGTGVITLIAPNTNTDRTVTLPDESITLAGGVDGIVSSADATAITIDSSENVGIGVVPESWHSVITALQIGDAGSVAHRGDANVTYFSNNAYIESSGSANPTYIETDEASQMYLQDGKVTFQVAPSGTADAAISWTTALQLTNDGRGLSQFTAKAWVNFEGNGTVAINDSHNVSSIADNAVGQYTVTYVNSMANTSYSVVSGDANWGAGWNNSLLTGSVSTKRRNESGGYTDAAAVCVQIFGD
jgi:hypothetical protein